MDPSMFEVEYPFATRWKISEESLRKAAVDKDSFGYVESDKLKIVSLPGVEYYFIIFPKWKDQEVDEASEISVIEFKLKENGTEIDPDLTLSIESANYASKMDKWDSGTWENIIGTTVELFDPEKKFIVNGKLILEVKGVLKVKKQKEQKSKIQKNSSLAEGLWNADDKDFVIEADGNLIRVHKYVLKHRSPMFAAMFESNMKESTENRTQITDFSFDVVETAIKYCYELDISDLMNLSIAIQLLQFSDKYHMNAFKDNLETYLIKEISLSTVYQLTNASIISNARELNEKCFEFLLKCMENHTPVSGFDDLDDDFVKNLCKRSLFPSLSS